MPVTAGLNFSAAPELGVAAWPARGRGGSHPGRLKPQLCRSCRQTVECGRLVRRRRGVQKHGAAASAAPRIPDFYRTSRQGSFRYNIPLKQGIYELRLHFAETEYDPELPEGGGEGSRILTVRANGRALLTRFDIVADAGASRTADVKVFPGIAALLTDSCIWSLAAKKASRPPSRPSRFCPDTAITFGPCACLPAKLRITPTTAIGGVRTTTFWAGNWQITPTPVSGTDDPELYETERWGNFSYAIPVSPGKYTVLLHFAARHGNWDQSASSGDGRPAVAHVFNLFCNGNALLKNFDLAYEARKTTWSRASSLAWNPMPRESCC
jgi:hypothetical protein